MSRLRFSLAQQVLDAVPDLADDMTLPAAKLDPLVYINTLIAGGATEQAVAFCSFLLPRREAVQWLCQCVRSSGYKLPPTEDALLAQAEIWVKTPTEASRKAVSSLADASSKAGIGAWAALAAAWSGGNMTKDDEHPVPPPAHLTGVAVKVGQHLLTLTVPEAQRAALREDSVKRALGLLKQEKT